MSENKKKDAKPSKSKRSFPESKRDYRQELTDSVIKMMESSAEYETPWLPNGQRPHNPVTGTVYRGINAISLMIAGHSDSRFLTYNNIQTLDKKEKEENSEASIHLRRGEVGTPIFKAKKIVVRSKGDESGEMSGMEEPKDGDRTLMIMVYAGTVFNAEQIEGMPPEIIKELKFDPVEKAEFMIEAMQKETGLKWRHKNEGRAYYHHSTDEVTLPEKKYFKTIVGYYNTAMHEMGHATGHPSRLNRRLASKGADLQSYAFEELIAEISSYFMEHEVGIPYDPSLHDNHASYLQSWLAALKNDKNLLFKACGAASKVVDYQVRIANEYRAKMLEEFDPASLPDFTPVQMSDDEEIFTIDDVMEGDQEEQNVAPVPMAA